METDPVPETLCFRPIVSATHHRQNPIDSEQTCALCLDLMLMNYLALPNFGKFITDYTESRPRIQTLIRVNAARTSNPAVFARHYLKAMAHI
jgi:hypothetical protein